MADKAPFGGQRLIPKRWIEAFLQRLMPRSSGDRLADLLETDFLSASDVIISDLRSRLRRAFDIHVIAGGIAALTIPFVLFKQTSAAPLIALVGAGAITLRFRDAWIQPAQGTFSEASMDALVTASPSSDRKFSLCSRRPGC